MTVLTNAANPDQFELSDLLRIMERLRDPSDGCPWDTKQTFTSVIPHTLEECYELVDAIEQGDLPHVAEELGDVLFTCVNFARHLRISSELALRSANQKFDSRFRFMENELQRLNIGFKDVSSTDFNKLWNKSKQSGS